MKIFSSVWLHYENCCRKYFHVFGSILKMLFSYKIFTLSQLFSQHPNKFLLQKISKSQPNPNPRNKSQPNPNTTHHQNSNSTHDSKLRQSKATTTKTPLPHHHNNNKNQNHIEIKITQRKRLVGRRLVGRRRDRAKARLSGGKIEGKIERRGAIDKTGAIWCIRSSNWSSGFAGNVECVIWAPSSLSLSLSLSLWKPFEVKIGTKMNFNGQSIFFTVK